MPRGLGSLKSSWAPGQTDGQTAEPLTLREQVREGFREEVMPWVNLKGRSVTGKKWGGSRKRKVQKGNQHVGGE